LEPLSWIVPLRHLHVSLVLCSGALFAARGLAVLAGAAWPLRRAARTVSVVIDTALLAAGATLWTMLQIHPLREAWLGAKLALLVLYIMLGSLALKRARTPAGRAAAFAAALAVYGTMLSIALSRHPLGAWRLLA
jgi:uncharacterized membrane protein SirB2